MRTSFQQQTEEPSMKELEDGATSIMLRRLPLKMVTETLLQVLDEVVQGRYDFVYVPHDRHKDRSVALAFVNFVDHESAKKVFSFVRGLVNHPELGSGVRVTQADIQGFHQNLAYFVARFGMQEIENPHAPRVYENGVRVNLLEAVTKHLSMETLAQAQRRMKTVAERKTGQKQQQSQQSPQSPQQSQHQQNQQQKQSRQASHRLDKGPPGLPPPSRSPQPVNWRSGRERYSSSQSSTSSGDQWAGLAEHRQGRVSSSPDASDSSWCGRSDGDGVQGSPQAEASFIPYPPMMATGRMPTGGFPAALQQVSQAMADPYVVCKEDAAGRLHFFL